MAELGTVVALIKSMSGADPAVIEEAVQDWLDDHPEATTTVQDGSITEAKLAQDVLADLAEVEGLKEAIASKLDATTVVIPGSVNIFDKGSATQDSYIAYGPLKPLSGFYASDYIEVTPGETYTRSDAISAKQYCAFYESKSEASAIQNSSTSETTFTAPQGAHYFRYTIMSGNINSAMLVKGSTLPSEYVPYSPGYTGTQITDFENSFSTEAKEDIKDYVLGSDSWRGKKVLCIGDSLTNSGTWWKQLEDVLGMDVSKKAKGGLPVEGFFTADDLSDGEGHTGPLTCADVYDKDLILVFGGTNDRRYLNGPDLYSIGQVGDVWSGSGSKTIAGCVQFAINHLYQLLQGDGTYAANLKARVAFITPYYVGKQADYPFTGIEDYDGNGVSTMTIAQMMQDVCDYNGIPCYSAFKNSGIQPNTWAVWASSSTPGQEGAWNDQLHLNTSGYVHLGKCIAKWVATI